VFFGEGLKEGFLLNPNQGVLFPTGWEKKGLRNFRELREALRNWGFLRIFIPN